MKRILLVCFTIAISLSLLGISGEICAYGAGEKPKQVVIFKLDDLQNTDASIRNFERVVQFAEENDIKVSFGIIADVLENPAKPDYIQRIKAMADSPRVEIWNHGYSLKKAQKLNSSNAAENAEYSHQTVETYIQNLKLTQNLVYDTLGVTMHSLGAPGNMTDNKLSEAMKKFPEIRSIFFPSPASYASFQKIGMQVLRTINWENPFQPANTRFDMESGTGKLDYNHFITNYNKGPGNSVKVFQGHPWGWDDSEFEILKNIVNFLKDEGAVFMTPHEYYVSTHPGETVKDSPSNGEIPEPEPSKEPEEPEEPEKPKEWQVVFADDFQNVTGLRPPKGGANYKGPDMWSEIYFDKTYDTTVAAEPGNEDNAVLKLEGLDNSAVRYPNIRKCVDISMGKTRMEFRFKCEPGVVQPNILLRSQSGTQVPLITVTSGGVLRFGYSGDLTGYKNEWQTVRLEFDAATRELDFYLTNSDLKEKKFGPYTVPIPEGFDLANTLLVLQMAMPAGTALDKSFGYYDDVKISSLVTKDDMVVNMDPISLLVGDSGLLPEEQFVTSSLVTRAGNAEGKFRIYNNTGEGIAPVLFAAVYDEEQKCLSMENLTAETIAAGSSKEVILDFIIPEGITDGILKFMLWNSADKMEPLIQPIIKKVETQRTLRLSNIFQDGVVLQRDKPIRVFGEASEGAEVTVTLAGKTAVAVAKEGRFLAEFVETFSANSIPQTMTVTSSMGETVTVNDVLIGDVLVGGGQSNMAMTFRSNLQKIPLPGIVPENIRWFKLHSGAGVSDVGMRYQPENNGFADKEKWASVNIGNVGDVSAVMYFAAEKLRAVNPDVPVGIVIDAWGGSLIQQWISPDTLEAGADSAYDSWRTQYADGANVVTSIPYSPVAGLYHYQTATIMPFAVKAFAWYQGESNASPNMNYHLILKDMIEDYRVKWQDAKLPVFIIQLPGWHDEQWNSFRLKQAWVEEHMEDVFLVVTNDTGDDRTLEQVTAAGFSSGQYTSVTIHPADKQPIGDRLARSICVNLDGMDLAAGGPVFTGMAGAGTNSVALSFANVHDGLVSQAADGTLPGFEVSADGKMWIPASALIDGEQVILSAETSIRFVRYGYVPGVLKSLAGSAEKDNVNFPAAPFRTDEIF